MKDYFKHLSNQSEDIEAEYIMQISNFLTQSAQIKSKQDIKIDPWVEFNPKLVIKESSRIKNRSRSIQHQNFKIRHQKKINQTKKQQIQASSSKVQFQKQSSIHQQKKQNKSKQSSFVICDYSEKKNEFSNICCQHGQILEKFSVLNDKNIKIDQNKLFQRRLKIKENLRKRKSLQITKTKEEYLNLYNQKHNISFSEKKYEHSSAKSTILPSSQNENKSNTNILKRKLRLNLLKKQKQQKIVEMQNKSSISSHFDSYCLDELLNNFVLNSKKYRMFKKSFKTIFYSRNAKPNSTFQ